MNPTHAQVKSFLQRWGYSPIEGDVKPDGTPLSNYGRLLRDEHPGSVWGLAREELFLPPKNLPDRQARVDELIKGLAYMHKLPIDNIRRIMLAEPGPLRDLGKVYLEPQQIEEWGDRRDHAPATISMDERGRDRLIAALIEGRPSIDVYGSSGGGYQLRFSIVQP